MKPRILLLIYWGHYQLPSSSRAEENESTPRSLHFDSTYGRVNPADAFTPATDESRPHRPAGDGGRPGSDWWALLAIIHLRWVLETTSRPRASSGPLKAIHNGAEQLEHVTDAEEYWEFSQGVAL